MNLRKALSVIFLTAIIANASLLAGCKEEEGGNAEAPAEQAPPAEAAPAEQAPPADAGDAGAAEGGEAAPAEGGE